MRAVLPLLAAGLLVLFVGALAVGERNLPPGQVLSALTGGADVPGPVRTIVIGLRLPRATLAVCVGAALGVAGAVCQAMMRNPLAEPGLLGINAGASLVAMVVIVQSDSLPYSLLPWLTLAGALAMSTAIQVLAWRAGTTSLRLILIGVGLSSMAGAGASFIATFGDVPAVQRALLWLAGSLQDSRWPKVQMLLVWSLPPMVMAWLLARELDLMAFGDDVARGLGQRVQRLRVVMVVACALISGAAVAAAGLVAFVGLAAPHLARMLVGPGHRRLIPASALVGAALLLAADGIARRVMPPIQLPAGLVTALLGTPFFAALLWARRND